MSNGFGIILKSMFRNKLRFGTEATKRKKIGFAVLLGMTYALIMTILLMLVISLGTAVVGVPQFAMMLYFMILITAALFVLIFGIVHLVSVLFLSKDTDFFSTLPVKPVTIFAAKLAFVYIFEMGVVAAVMLPLIITFGIVAKLWAWFYVISILMLVIVPSLPLAVAAILAIPVMYIASKLKNRNIVSLIFFMLLFGGFFAVYIYVMFASTDISGEGGVITEEQLNQYLKTLEYVFYAFYPYTVLSLAAVGIPSHGLALGASTVVNIAIFLVISVALIGVLLLLGRFMYGQSAKANNQTYNSKAKKGEFKARSGLKALIKREYVSSLRTTQTAFQCYAVFMLPIVFSVMLGIVFGNIFNASGDADMSLYTSLSLVISLSCITIMFASIGNAVATTFSREGVAIASLKALPIDIKQILRAKITAWAVIALPVAVVAVTIANAFNFDVAYYLLSLFGLTMLVAAFLAFGALWDLKAPKIKWTDPMQAIKHNTHVTGGQFMCMAVGLVQLILYMILLSTGVSLEIATAVYWAVLYFAVAVFVVVDILMYRHITEYYERIEI